MAADYIMEKLNVNFKQLHVRNAKSKLRGLASRNNQQDAGFTLLEVIVVAVIIGILGAIAAPGWLGFVNRQRLNKANDAVLSALQQAHRQAIRTKRDYSVSFQTNGNTPQFSIDQGTTPNNWRNLGEDVGIKPGEILLSSNITDNNKAGSSISNLSGTPKTITFDHMGTLPINTDFGTPPDGSTEPPGLKIVVAIPSNSNMKRCVIVKTLLGSMITEKDEKCN